MIYIGNIKDYENIRTWDDLTENEKSWILLTNRVSTEINIAVHDTTMKKGDIYRNANGNYYLCKNDIIHKGKISRIFDEKEIR